MKRGLRTSLVAATLGVAGVVGFGSVASAAGAQELDLCALLGDPYCPPPVDGGDATVPAGGTLPIHGEGFLPGETVDVTICEPPISLGSFIADENGVVDATVTIPASIPPGTCDLVMSGQTSHNTVVLSVTITAAPASGGGGALAATGSETTPLVGIGLGLLAAGGVAAFAARRRATTV